MFIYINEYGYKVSKRKEYLVVEYQNGDKEEYLFDKLHAVYLAGEGRVSKATILELTCRNIDVLMLSEKGKPMVYIYPVWTKPKMWDLWKRQILLDPRKKAILARRFVLKAIKAKAELLRNLAKSRKRSNKELALSILNYRDRIRGIERRVQEIRTKDFKSLRKVLMGWEGFSAKLYFEALKYIIPSEFGYTGIRTRRPPKDLFNASISFGYSYLKYLVERELVFRGINPYYGILHQENDKVYPFLTFDVMEGFRHSFVDRIVVALISKRILRSNHSRKFDDGVHLNKYGQTILNNAFYKERINKLNKLISNEVNYLIKVMTN